MVADQLIEGLRERKKRLTRQLISDTATAMFLERGFDEVRVAEIAEACGISEKTVFNYFPTKESLLLDREEAMTAAIHRALGPEGPPGSPIDATLETLAHTLNEFSASTPGGADFLAFARFWDLVEGTPSLRSAQQDMMDRLTQVAARALAARAGVSPDDPEPQIAAVAILGLWRVQHNAMRRHATGGGTTAEIAERVTTEVRRAARLIDSGLWAFEVMVMGTGGREQLKAAAEAAQNAGRQVAAALRQAKAAWREAQRSARQTQRADWDIRRHEWDSRRPGSDPRRSSWGPRGGPDPGGRPGR